MKLNKIYILVVALVIILSFFMLSPRAFAIGHEIDVGAGKSTSNLETTQGTLLWAWIRKINNSLDLRIEPNLEIIVAKSGESMFFCGVTPVLRLGVHGKKLNPFLDFGAGVSISSKKKISDWDLGGYFFFSPTAGVGIKFGTSATGVSLFARFVHHSNADLFPPNQSLNTLYVLLGYRF